MATYVTVDNGDAALVKRARQVQQANRQADLERQRDANLEAQIALDVQSSAVEDPQGGLPSTAVDRRPAAQRRGGELQPFAITWRGTFTNNPLTPQTISLSLGVAPTDPPSTFEYSGGDLLDPSPIRLATSNAALAVPQASRSSAFNTRVQLFNSGYVGVPEVMPGYWATEIDTDTEMIGNPLTPISTAPTYPSPIGPVSYSPAPRYLAVSTAGSVFITVPLPSAPYSPTVVRDYMSINYSTVGYWNVFGQAAVGVGSQPAPVLFLKITDGRIESKTASKLSNDDWGTFYSTNCYPDDPSKDLRSTYFGEVRVRGNTAKILRMREVDELGAAVYTEFPFAGISTYVASPDGKPSLPSSVWFEEHIYSLPSYGSSAELAALLSGLAAPGTPGTQPVAQRKLVPSSGLFNSSRSFLGNDSGDVITPNTFFVYRS